ncbi:ABC transporter ATP-binding protein [Oryzibacter oryziterrae]|uniref:ABC transporter ATP-binding protein n=1 Tax=Oryzibacter oryziterrae TaxID=2766474 RepID=UPI001F184290|nr:ABC transporter ATP-binding protein [Oryzibacter oryziterrae]
MADPLITLDGVTRRFDMPRRFGQPALSMLAVDGVSVRIARGEVVGVVGESGCGKSTLARLVLRLIEPSAGTVTFDGTDLTDLSADKMRLARRRMSMVFQDPYSSLDPRYTLEDVLSEPFRAQGLKVPPGRIDELLTAVGLSNRLAHAYPHQLSGGQRQRVGIARALALSPEFMVLDEPTASLDVSIQAQIIDLLLRLAGERSLTYLFISHDLGLVSYFCDRILVMYFGRIVEVLPGPKAVPRHPYTRALMDSSFVPDPAARRTLVPITGEPPSVHTPPPGCAFAARCIRASDSCRTTRPPLAETPDGAAVACHHPIA